MLGKTWNVLSTYITSRSQSKWSTASVEKIKMWLLETSFWSRNLSPDSVFVQSLVRLISAPVLGVQGASSSTYVHASNFSTLPTSDCCTQAWKPKCQSVTASPLGLFQQGCGPHRLQLNSQPIRDQIHQLPGDEAQSARWCICCKARTEGKVEAPSPGCWWMFCDMPPEA